MVTISKHIWPECSLPTVSLLWATTAVAYILAELGLLGNHLALINIGAVAATLVWALELEAWREML